MNCPHHSIAQVLVASANWTGLFLGDETRTLLGASGIATRSKDATNGAPGLTTRNKKLRTGLLNETQKVLLSAA